MIATLSLVGFTSSYLKPKVVSATVLEAKPIEPITIEIEPISIEINETEMFLDAIGHRESSNRYTVVNKWGYMGKYQFGKRTLKSLGYDVSRKEFLNSPHLQEMAMMDLLLHNKKALQPYIDKHEGIIVDGYEITESGILAGFPMIDYKVTILDGLHHDVDSSVLAFEIASRMCFREACTKATLKLLEPMMKVEVVTPEDFMGDVIGDLNSRRGQVGSTEPRGNATAIQATVPLANMFGYINNLRSSTQGRAQYTMQFSHYDKVPQNVQDEVTKKLA